MWQGGREPLENYYGFFRRLKFHEWIEWRRALLLQ
jgi:hypothetical protein